MDTLRLIRTAAALVCLGALAGCASNWYVGDQKAVASVKKVAIIAFQAPNQFKEQRSDSEGSSVTSLMALKNFATGKGYGNAPDLIDDMYQQFVETFPKHHPIELVPHEAVISNAAFQAIAEDHYDDGYERTSVAGLKTIYFHDDEPATDFASEAAEALGVDGVILVDVYDMSFVMKQWRVGAGDSSGVARGFFQMYDRDGEVVWQSMFGVSTPETAVMVMGTLTPEQMANLSGAAGKRIAERLVEELRAGGPK